MTTSFPVVALSFRLHHLNHLELFKAILMS